MSDRGEFRSIHTVLVDGPEYQALTPHERLMVFVVKMSLGASGIDVVPSMIGTLCERTGLDAAEASAVLDSLERQGWVRRERNILWLVDGLRHEPTLSPTNGLHVKGVVRHVRGLPHLDIVGAFIEAYPAWFSDDAKASIGYPFRKDDEVDPIDSHGIGSTGVGYTLSKQDVGSRREEKGEREEKPLAAGAASSKPKRKRTTPRAPKPKPADTGEAASSWLTPAGEAWEGTFGAGSFDYGRAAKILSRLHRAGVEPDEIGRRLAEYVRRHKGGFCKLSDFAERHGEYVPSDRGPVLLEGGVLSAYGEELTRPDGMPAPKGWYS